MGFIAPGMLTPVRQTKHGEPVKDDSDTAKPVAD
jgi:hypothetical protein